MRSSPHAASRRRSPRKSSGPGHGCRSFHRLRERLDELEVGPDLDELREQASRLLLYHQWMLREALTAACSARAARSGRSGYRINGLGAPANRLRELRDGLATLVDTRA